MSSPMQQMLQPLYDDLVGNKIPAYNADADSFNASNVPVAEQIKSIQESATEDQAVQYRNAIEKAKAALAKATEGFNEWAKGFVTEPSAVPSTLNEQLDVIESTKKVLGSNGFDLSGLPEIAKVGRRKSAVSSGDNTPRRIRGFLWSVNGEAKTDEKSGKSNATVVSAAIKGAITSEDLVAEFLKAAGTNDIKSVNEVEFKVDDAKGQTYHITAVRDESQATQRGEK